MELHPKFWEFTLRLSVAFVLGAIIGLDRTFRAKDAGFRTHILVSIGSALIMIISPMFINVFTLLKYPFAVIVDSASAAL